MYVHMYRFICRETRTLSPAEYLMVGCKTILENRNWASFYMKKEKIDRLKKALKEGKCLVTGMDLREMFSISVGDRMGTQYLPWGKDCHMTRHDGRHCQLSLLIAVTPWGRDPVDGIVLYHTRIHITAAGGQRSRTRPWSCSAPSCEGSGG